jgi:hypothetical protein
MVFAAVFSISEYHFVSDIVWQALQMIPQGRMAPPYMATGLADSAPSCRIQALLNQLRCRKAYKLNQALSGIWGSPIAW